MNYNATSLSVNDQIFATLEVGGKTVASISKSNFSSINDIVRFVCAIAGRFMGLARLNIRNKTQGWAMNLSLASRQSAPRPSFHAAMPAQHRQASLFN